MQAIILDCIILAKPNFTSALLPDAPPFSLFLHSPTTISRTVTTRLSHSMYLVPSSLADNGRTNSRLLGNVIRRFSNYIWLAPIENRLFLTIPHPSPSHSCIILSITSFRTQLYTSPPPTIIIHKLIPWQLHPTPFIRTPCLVSAARMFQNANVEHTADLISCHGYKHALYTPLPALLSHPFSLAYSLFHLFMPLSNPHTLISLDPLRDKLSPTDHHKPSQLIPDPYSLLLSSPKWPSLPFLQLPCSQSDLSIDTALKIRKLKKIKFKKKNKIKIKIAKFWHIYLAYRQSSNFHKTNTGSLLSAVKLNT